MENLLCTLEPFVKEMFSKGVQAAVLEFKDSEIHPMLVIEWDLFTRLVDLDLWTPIRSDLSYQRLLTLEKVDEHKKWLFFKSKKVTVVKRYLLFTINRDVPTEKIRDMMDALPEKMAERESDLNKTIAPTVHYWKETEKNQQSIDTSAKSE